MDSHRVGSGRVTIFVGRVGSDLEIWTRVQLWTGPATVKLLISSVRVLVLGTDSNPVPADRRCRLPAMAEIARQCLLFTATS